MPSNEEISGTYTGWQEGAQLAIIEELMMIGRLSFANRLKSVITDPMLRIIEKYLRAYSIPNHLNLICFTNHSDGLHLESGDRRWLVIASPAKVLEAGYYKKLFTHIDSIEGQAAVKHYLMTRDVRLDPKGRAPETSAKEDMRSLSESDAERYLRECFEQADPPFETDLVRSEDIKAHLDFHGLSNSRNIMRSITKFLQGINAIQAPRNTSGDYPKYRLWIVRNHKQWIDAGATACIQTYMTYTHK